MSLNSLMYCLLAALASHHQVTICINIWVMGRQRMAVEEEGNLGVILRASKSFSLKIQIDNCFGKKSPPIHHNGFLNTSATHFEMLLKPLHIYDDDETLNSFNEETFNSLQRLVAKQCQKRDKTLILKLFFCVCSLMKSETYQIKTDFHRRHQHEEPKNFLVCATAGKSTSKEVRDFRMRKRQEIFFWCEHRAAKLHIFYDKLQCFPGLGFPKLQSQVCKELSADAFSVGLS